MNSLRTASSNITLIQEVFWEAKSMLHKSSYEDAMGDFLKKVPADFISIAFEGMSMAIADEALKQAVVSFDKWQVFLEQYGRIHGVQIFIGLGWALGQHQINPSSYAHLFDKGLYWRVYDGLGYYEGLFKRRRIQQQIFSSFIDAASAGPYMQGIGRSLWYQTKADLSLLEASIHAFSVKYHADLWRGIGLASAYVGGLKFNTLHELSEMSGDYLTNLSAGAAMAYYSRFKADTFNEANFDWCKIWNNQTIDELVSLMRRIEHQHYQCKVLDYHAWINSMDNLYELIMN